MAEHGNVVYSFANEAALAGDWVISFELPHAFMPRHLSVVGTNSHDATIKIGDSSDDNALLADTAIGDSDDPTEYDRDNWVDADYQYSKGDVVKITVTYGGSGGTAIQDPVIVLTGLFGL